MSGSFRTSQAGLRHLAILIISGSVAGFATGAAAEGIPTGAAGPSYIPPGMTKFSQPMPRFDVLPRKAITALVPAPTEQANTSLSTVRPGIPGVVNGSTGPIEGRPPGAVWAHQGWTRFPAKVSIEVTQAAAHQAGNPLCSATVTSGCYNPGVASHF